MSKSIGIRWVKYFSIFMTLLLVFGCAITPVNTITQDSSGKTLSSTTEYRVSLAQIIDNKFNPKQSDDPIVNFTSKTKFETFKDLKSAQTRVAEFHNLDSIRNDPSMYDTYTLFLLTPGIAETRIVKQDSLTNTQNNTQTSVQQDIASTGNSATQEPPLMSVCNVTLNGQCNVDTVTAVTGVVATAVMGGITAAVLTSMNNKTQKAQKAQDNQNNINILTILKTTATGAAGGPSCQCQSATVTSPPYCGAGIC